MDTANAIVAEYLNGPGIDNKLRQTTSGTAAYFLTDHLGTRNLADVTYDDVGNRTASHQGSSYSYQAFNRLVAANGTSFGYDANGNQTSKFDARSSWTYIWYYENRLKQSSFSGG